MTQDNKTGTSKGKPLKHLKMTILATKKDRTTIFNLLNMSESEALKFAKGTIKRLTRERFGKRAWGWEFKVK